MDVHQPLQPLTTSFAMRPRGQTRVALPYTLIGCSTREAATSPVVYFTHTRWKSVVERLHVYALRGACPTWSTIQTHVESFKEQTANNEAVIQRSSNTRPLIYHFCT